MEEPSYQELRKRLVAYNLAHIFIDDPIAKPWAMNLLKRGDWQAVKKTLLKAVEAYQTAAEECDRLTAEYATGIDWEAVINQGKEQQNGLYRNE